MYRYIKGTLVEILDDSIVVETNAIGYELFVPPGYFEKLPSTGSSIICHTSFVVRELSQALYGFMTKGERDLFESVLNISGVGPKLALNIVGKMRPEELYEALIQKNSSILCKIPGVGKKTAERLLLELKNISLTISSVELAPQHPKYIQDAISALINLGYTPQESKQAVSKTSQIEPELHDTASLISKSLQLL